MTAVWKDLAHFILYHVGQKYAKNLQKWQLHYQLNRDVTLVGVALDYCYYIPPLICSLHNVVLY